MGPRAYGLLLAACGGLLAACGGAPPPAVGVDAPTTARPPIDLTLLDLDGNVVEVRRHRGETLLLFLFATFDGGSQLALTPLSSFVRAHPEVPVIGVAVQPNARTFADAWAAALTPPFPVTWEPAETIPEGTSGLGRLDGIPTFVAIGPDGRERRRHVGVPTLRELEALVAPR